ncbi:serine/threonine-protein kinase [Thermodesulfobacteriota bacterium]
MISSLKNLVQIAKNIPDDQVQDIHAIAMDLINSMVRHFAVVAIAAYRHAGARDETVNEMIARKLPWPSDGSWKNILQKLAKADKTLFPDNFSEIFLAPLSKNANSPALSATHGFANRMLEYAASGDEKVLEIRKDMPCSPLDFFDVMVSYRNAFIGHGTQMMSKQQIEFAPYLKKGAIALCDVLRPLWLHFPIYRAEKASESGAEFHRLTPLTSDQDISQIDSKDENVAEGRLYVCFDKRTPKAAPIYPIALWDDEDVLFLNGAIDYKSIKYMGYVKGRMKKTDKHETAFCNFIIPFMGGISLDTLDLSDARALSQAMQLMDSGWTFPRLSKAMEIGSEGSRYRLIEEIGSGGMAVVWRAVAMQDSREVAIKFLRNPVNAARFRREARTLEKVSRNCANIVKYIDFQFDPHPSLRVAFLVMELLSGKSLKDRVKEQEPITTNDILCWLEDSFKGLSVVHEVGAVHRDIKPSNFMLDSKGKLKLADLGLVGVTDNAGMDLSTTTGLTQNGTAIGTYEFSSLEQLQGGASGIPVGPKSDIFSMGASFYYIITGTFPYGSGSLAVIIENHLKAAPKHVSDICDDHPKLINDLIMALISVDPDLRWDIKTVLSKIEEYREGKSSNVNLNIIGQDVDARFDNLMPTWINWYLFKFWPAFILAEFVTAYVFTFEKDLWLNIDSGTYEFIPVNFSIYPFCRDSQYILWHVLPLISILFLLRIARTIQPIMQDIQSLDINKSSSHWNDSARLNANWAAFVKCKITWLVIAIASMLGCYTTYTKVMDWEKCGIFWSDYRISMLGFLLKESLVFINHSAFLFFFLFIVAIIWIVTFILRGAELTVDLYHFDNDNGLAPVSRMLSLFLPLLSIMNYSFAIITVINKSVFQTYWVFLGILMLSFSYFFFLFLPIMPVHRQINKFKSIELHLFSERRKIIEEKIRNYLKLPVDFSQEQTDNVRSLTDLRVNIQEAEHNLYKHNMWPIKKWNLWFLIILGGFPPMIPLVSMLYRSVIV